MEDDVSPEPGTEAFNFLAARFAQLLGECIRAGLHRGYVERHQSGAFLQGRLDVAAQVRTGTSRKDRLHCTYEEFTADVPYNQVLKATALLLLHSPLLHDRVAAQVHQLLPALEGITTVPLLADRFCELLPTRLTAAYRQLLELCRLLFDGLAAGKESGAVVCPAFLLDMERVFERYVSEGVREAFGNHPRYSVAMQPLHSVAPPKPAQPDLQIRPDMLVSLDGQPVAVLDAKWKKLSTGALRPADVYQVLAYAAILGVSRAILVYPGRRNRRWQYPFDRTGSRLEVYTLRVTGSPRACQRSLRDLGNTLRSSVMN